MLRILSVCLLCFVFFSCTDVYYKQNGEKMKVWNQRQDPIFVNDEKLKDNAFNLNSFLKPNEDSNSSIQYVLPSDLLTIAQKTNELFVIFYYPNCPAAEAYVQLAKTVENRNIPVLLLSYYNSPNRMKEWYDKIGLKNKNLYIIPYSNTFDSKVFTKQIQFLAELCPPCYETYKDELQYTFYILLKDNEIMLSLKDKVYTQEDGLKWLEKNLDEQKEK